MFQNAINIDKMQDTHMKYTRNPFTQHGSGMIGALFVQGQINLESYQ